MIYEVYVPKFPLGQFITHFNYYKGHNPGHRIDRFLPNGNTEIVIDLTSAPKYIYDNDSLLEKQACNKLWISGIRNKYISIPSSKDSEMFVVNFKKGMVRPFLQMPLHEITDKVVDGDIILHRVFLEIREALLEIGNVSAMFEMVEKKLTNVYQPVMTVNPFIDYAVADILKDPRSAKVKAIADKTGYSSKHFITMFKDHVGVNPKTFMRITRFQKIITEIERSRKINWAGLAVESGYYDQSHFIDDFKLFSGFTPNEYVMKKNNELNYVPIL